MNAKEYKILIVDDSSDDREYYRRLLKKGDASKYSFIETDSGEEGLELFIKEAPDCIILDYNLPDLDGIEFLSRLQGDKALGLPIVMLTGEGNETVAVEAMKSGVQDYLIKGSINAEILQLAIQNAMEKVSLRKQLDAQRLELERSNRELDQYARIVAHDLRTPLFAIIGFLELFTSIADHKLDAEEREIVSSLQSCATTMQTLLKDVLDYSRLNGIKPEFQQLDLNETLKQVVKNLDASIQGTNATVNIPEMPVLQGNPTNLLQLFQNLIGNGIKFCRGRAPVINVGVRLEDGYYQFYIQDNGIGMPEDGIQKIFGAFERLHSNQEFAGTGLGLSICKKIVELHGGEIWVESQLDVGSTFHFTIPVRE